jgi:hypothetical protein
VKIIICKGELNMNKRFLYRAKTIDTGDLVFGSLVYSPKEDEYYIVEHNGEELSWLIDENTIEQCTGFEDDEGYLIFEGDEVILENYGSRGKYKIVWRGGNFKLQNERGECLYRLSECLPYVLELINPTYIE